MLEQVRQDGIYVIENHLCPTLLDDLEHEVRSKFDTMEDEQTLEDNVDYGSKYTSGKFLRIDKTRNEYPLMSNLFDSGIFNPLPRSYGCQYPHFQTFVSYEYKMPDELPRNSRLHFDPYNAFKFLIYLTDTTKENGAFCCFRGSREDGEAARKSIPLQVAVKDGYLASSHESLKKYTEEEPEYIEGKRGTILIIDTDIIHAGGILLKEGVERLVINHHSR